MHKVLVLVNRLGGLSLPRKSMVTLTDHPDMTIAVYCGSETMQQQQQFIVVQPTHPDKTGDNLLYNHMIVRIK